MRKNKILLTTIVVLLCSITVTYADVVSSVQFGDWETNDGDKTYTFTVAEESMLSFNWTIFSGWKWTYSVQIVLDGNTIVSDYRSDVDEFYECFLESGVHTLKIIGDSSYSAEVVNINVTNVLGIGIGGVSYIPANNNTAYAIINANGARDVVILDYVMIEDISYKVESILKSTSAECEFCFYS